MRFLAIDAGEKRTGLAVGDDATRIVTALEVVEASGVEELMGRIGGAIEEHGPGALVVGLPLDMGAEGEAGREGPAAAKARKLARELEKRFGLPVHLQDERLSSFAADQEMARTGLTRKGKKKKRDAVAAAAILRDFLDPRAPRNPRTPGN